MSGATADRMVVIDAAAPSPVVEIWRVLARHALLFVSVAAAIAVVGAAIVATLPRAYEATATVMVPPEAADPLQAQGAAATEAADDARTTTEAAMLASRDNAATVVRALGLGLVAPPPSPLARRACRTLGLGCPPAAPPAAPDLDRRIDGFLAGLLVVQEPHSRVLDVSFTDRDPEVAARAANAVVTAEQDAALARASGELDRTVGWLDRRTADLRERWLDAVGTANAFRVAHQLTAAGETGGGIGRGLSENEVQQGAASLLDAQARLAAAEAQEDALRRGGAAAMEADPEVAALAGQLATAEAARATGAGQLGPANPELRALDNAAASARASLREATGRALAAVSDRARAARAEVAQLESGLRTLKGNAGAEAGPVARFETLQQEAASARIVYETFLTRQKELADRAGILRPPVEFVSHAPVPTEPSAPKRARLLAGVIALALAAGAAAAFLGEHLARGFRDVDRLRHHLRLPLLSLVPRVEGRREAVFRHVIEAPYGRASEAMRSLMARVALAAGPGETSQTVLIGSAAAREGKTTIATWLAVLAAGGAPTPDDAAPAAPGVLLIDADHRRGLVASQFGADPRAPGMTELLAAEATLAEVLQTDLRTGVRFIAAGRLTARPLGQAEIARLEALLAGLRREYRLIVIDSPPLMGMSDALVYARLASQTVFVCRWRDTARGAAAAALDRLREAGARLTGVVVSMVDPREAVQYGGEYGPRPARELRRLHGS